MYVNDCCVLFICNLFLDFKLIKENVNKKADYFIVFHAYFHSPNCSLIPLR